MIAKKAKGNPRVDEALLELAQDFRGTLLSERTADKITMRILGGNAPTKPTPLEPEEIRAIREDAQMSQAVFAAVLNVTAGYLSKLERGAIRPAGPGACPAECHPPQGHRRGALKAGASETARARGDDRGEGDRGGCLRAAPATRSSRLPPTRRTSGPI